METQQILDEIASNTTALKQQADKLDKSLVELQTLYKTLPVVVPGLVIGAGQYSSNPNLLSDEQLNDITSNVAKGNLVLVVLNQDLFKPGSVIARCIGVQDGYMASVRREGVWLRCVPLGKSECVAANAIIVKDPPKQVWGWCIYSKFIGA